MNDDKEFGYMKEIGQGGPRKPLLQKILAMDAQEPNSANVSVDAEGAGTIDTCASSSGNESARRARASRGVRWSAMCAARGQDEGKIVEIGN